MQLYLSQLDYFQIYALRSLYSRVRPHSTIVRIALSLTPFWFWVYGADGSNERPFADRKFSKSGLSYPPFIITPKVQVRSIRFFFYKNLESLENPKHFFCVFRLKKVDPCYPCNVVDEDGKIP
jgi:hypothetical protein